MVLAFQQQVGDVVRRGVLGAHDEDPRFVSSYGLNLRRTVSDVLVLGQRQPLLAANECNPLLTGASMGR